MDKILKTRFVGFSFALALMSSLGCQAQSHSGALSLPTPTQEAKPGVRWWWMGSAVDKENLKWNLDEYAKSGIGAVEIIHSMVCKEMIRMIFRISLRNGWRCSNS